MLRKAKGRIINVSAICGRLAAPYFGPLVASKFALEAITDCLRIEFRSSGVEVLSILSGSFQNTDLANKVELTYFLSGKSSIPVNAKKLVIAIDLLPEIFSIGLSSLLFPITVLIQSFVIFQSISHHGTQNDIVFFGATGQIASFVFIPINGFAQALQPIIGINYGANNYVRLKKAYLVFGMIGTLFLLLMWLPLQFSTETFLGILLPHTNFTTADLINFRIISALTPICPLAFFGNTLFQSIGKGRIVIIVILLRSIVFTLPAVIFISRFLGLRGVYLGIFLANILFMLITLILTIEEFKKLKTMKSKT